MRKIGLLAVGVLMCMRAEGQMLRYDQRREIAPPEYATLRLGPFYSNIAFEQTAGFRYTRSEGTGTDFLFGNNRGIIKEDGSEYPLVSRLSAQNYLMITRHMDLDISFSVGYAHYPLATQEDEFFFDFAEEGAAGSISTEFYITQYIRGQLSDDIVYRTDYIDLRGIKDNYGGSEFENLENNLKFTADWLMDEAKNLGMAISRTDLIVMSDGFESQERVTLAEDIYYEQQLAAFLVGGAQTSFEQTAYPSDDRADSSSRSYSLYTSAQLTDRTSAGASVGAATGSSDDLERGSTDTFTSGASLSTRISRELMHSLSFQRGLSGGFNAPFEISSSLGYSLSYNKERSSVEFTTGFSRTEPQGAGFNDYSGWQTGITLTQPMTRFISLICAAQYTTRENGDVTGTQLDDPEYTSDYETLSLRVGTSFSVTRKINFNIYGQHIDRMSDNPDLEYSRDIASATFTYKHAF